MNPSIFKAYDVRGIYGTELDEAAVAAIARAYVGWLRKKQWPITRGVVVARDVRESGPSLQRAFVDAAIACGVSCIDIGMVTTEMLYFAVAHGEYDGGVMVSASHNAREYNGLKFVRAGAQAISSDSGLFAIRDMALAAPVPNVPSSGSKGMTKNVMDDYVDALLRIVDVRHIRPFRLVANANFGMAGQVLLRLIERGKLPIEVIPMDFAPDGTFPKGKPDPLIPERRAETIAQIRAEKPDFGVAWDADADRVFFFDERGDFVEGYYTISLVAQRLLRGHSGETVLFDVRQTWASIDTITAAQGTPIMVKCGHAFIKDRMRAENAIFAGENSGHYYFRDFYGVDSGMIPLLLMLALLTEDKRPLSALVDPLRQRYPTSGEINTRVVDPRAVIAQIGARYTDGTVETLDGLSVEYPDWRFNLRASNTEPLLRLNVEAKTPERMRARTEELLAHIQA